MTVTAATRGADEVVATLRSAGIDHVFSLSGNQIMPVYDALVGSGIRLVHVRHEAAAVYMAEGYAQATGRLGVALLTAGSGFANGLGALPSALASETPVLLLTGDAPLSQAGLGAFQELDQAQASRPLVKASLKLADRHTIADDLTRAIDIALGGRPGPVHVAMPVDLLQARAPAVARLSAQAPRVPAAAPAELLSAVADLTAKAERPVALAGPTLARTCHRALVEGLAEAAGLPVVPMESPRGLRDPSLGTFAEKLAEADLVVALGKPLDFSVGFARPPAIAAAARLAVIDADPSMLRRASAAHGSRIAALVEAEPIAAADTLRRVMVGRDVSARAGWRAEVERAIGHRPSSWARIAGGPGALHPVVLCRVIAAAMAGVGSPILVIDGGEIGQWAQACLSAPMRIINGVSGTIGGSIPYAVAAKAAHPDRPVLAVMGDGTFGFHMAEIDTAVREGLAVVLVVGNDAAWNAEHQIQLRDYGVERAHGCRLLPTRYDLVAAALGAHGEHVTDAEALAPALARALAAGRPAVVNVAILGLPAPVVRSTD